MWIVGIIGLVAALLAIVLSFIPPSQISTGSPVIYVSIILAGCAFFAAVPFVVYAVHKPSWKAAGSDFEPFDWELEGRTPGQVAKAPLLQPKVGAIVPAST